MRSASADPQARRLIVERLEGWLLDRQRHSGTPLADWEQDHAFLALATAEYPLDMEMARMETYKAQSARQRLRLRWEGYRLVLGARQKIEALHAAAGLALESLSETPPKKKTTRKKP